MKILVVTEESLERAKASVKHSYNCGTIQIGVINALNQALNALFVPQAEGWVIDQGDCLSTRYTKGGYQLVQWDSPMLGWRLYPINAKRNNETSIAQFPWETPITIAQTWADAEIEKYEGGRSCKPTTIDYEAKAKALKDMTVEEVAGFLRTVDEIGNKFQEFVWGKKP